MRPAAQSPEVAWGSSVMCVCRAPGKHSNRSNPTRTQLRFRHGLRVRMAVRGFESFPNDLGYTVPRGRGRLQNYTHLSPKTSHTPRRYKFSILLENTPPRIVTTAGKSFTLSTTQPRSYLEFHLSRLSSILGCFCVLRFFLHGRVRMRFERGSNSTHILWLYLLHSWIRGSGSRVRVVSRLLYTQQEILGRR